MRQIINWPEAEYHADREHVSKSWLDQIHRSPAHLKAYLEGLRPPTPEMEFGTLAHVWVLEPDSVESRYLKIPNLDRRRKADKEKYAELQADAQARNLTMIDEDTWQRASLIRDAVYAHKAAAAILGKGDAEQSVIWVNSETGEPCKARADWLRENFIADVKTTNDASPDAFARSMINYRYCAQHRHYCEGFDSPRLIWIAVEKAPPYAVAVYADSEQIRQRGIVERDPDLRLYAECRAKDEWPGFPEVVQEIALPRWAA
jgi:exodeoxyribonuclease VIII